MAGGFPNWIRYVFLMQVSIEGFNLCCLQFGGVDVRIYFRENIYCPSIFRKWLLMSDWIFKKSGEIIVLDAKTGILGRFFFFFKIHMTVYLIIMLLKIYILTNQEKVFKLNLMMLWKIHKFWISRKMNVRFTKNGQN